MAPKYEQARRMRKALTPPEWLLWERLKTRQPDRPVFRRQHAIGPYVLDFYCIRARLAVEVDGGQHYLTDAAETRDARRDAWLLSQGIMTYRVPAADVFADVEVVANGIYLLALERLNRR